MARKPRIDQPDCWHHVMNRGHRKNPIFVDDHDRRAFLNLAQSSFEATGVQLTSYCLMGNHYHLVLHCPDAGLSTAMQLLSSRYTRSFNKRHDGDGPLFRGRYTSVLITSDAQLLAVTRYVHRNPLELQYSLNDYPWSSYGSYLDGGEPHWLSAAFVLGLHGSRADHRRYVEGQQPSDRFGIRSGLRRYPGTTRNWRAA